MSASCRRRGIFISRHSGARLLARARNPEPQAVVVEERRRLAWPKHPPVVMDSGLATSSRPGMTERADHLSSIPPQHALRHAGVAIVGAGCCRVFDQVGPD